MDELMLQFTVEASKQTIQPDVRPGYVNIPGHITIASGHVYM